MNRQEFLPQFSGTKPNVTFDFTDELASGDTIDPNGVNVNCQVFSGTDPAPINIITATIVKTGTTVTQLLDFQNFGVAGTIYVLVCSAATIKGLILAKQGYLALLPEQ